MTDGTSAGTVEIRPAKANSLGLFDSTVDPDFTALGGKLLFQGYDTKGQWNLWVTDGTLAGTEELTPAGADPFDGLNPTDFTVIGKNAVFVGVGANGRDSLWATNGTSAGTHELKIKGGDEDKLFDDGTDFTVLGHKVLFEAVISDDGEAGLFVTDGTTGGTTQLHVNGAGPFGLFELVESPFFTVLGKKALFVGSGKKNTDSLWITDGTAAGTIELNSSELFNEFARNPHFTVFGSKAIFVAGSPSFTDYLWVTDGTAAGTKKLNVKGASSLGLVDDDSEFISLGTKVLFTGRDADNNDGLWITDGTAAGTKELAVNGAWFGGVINPAGDPDFTRLGNEVLFNGTDVSGLPSLWVTDGTSAGTKEISVAGAWSNGLDPAEITAFPPPPKTPSPSGLALAAASDSGVQGDGITIVTRPTITGKGVAGDKVTLHDGAKVIGTAVVAKGGAWSVTPATALAVGVHTLAATETGKTGTSAASAPLKLTIEAPPERGFTGRALFAGGSPNDRTDLWVTDGTASGTTDLTPPGASSPLNVVGDITVVGARVFFVGRGADGLNLWTTDGTSAGTRELTAAGANSDGLFAFEGVFGDTGPHFTALGSKVVFKGEDAGGHPGLWVTNGTSSGTKELTVAGANPNGLFYASGPSGTVDVNPGLTAFGKKALFLGAGINGYNLWVTDGSSHGTRELTAKGAYSGGLFSSQIIDGPHFAVLGNKAVFEGTSARTTGDDSLWVTDGTSAGTKELTIGGNELAPRGDFGILGDKALFLGLLTDDSGVSLSSGLWVTDGTSAGTRELTDKAEPDEIAVFGKKAVFRDGAALWVTDGTSAGTREIATAAANPQGFAVLGNKVLFAASDPRGRVFNLWITDGTASGTKQLTFVNRGPVSAPFGLSPQDITVIGNGAVFAGATGTSIFSDLWVTDGTRAGTRRLKVAGAETGGGFMPHDITAIPAVSPPPSELALARASDSGVKGDRIADDRTPTITGEGVAGDKVTLRDGAKVIGTAVVEKGGTWSLTPRAAVAVGVHSLTATDAGAATWASAASAALRLTIKTSAPAPSGLSFAVAADKGSGGDTFTVAGRGEAGDRVTLFDGSKALRGATVGAGGAWTVTLNPLAIGAHSLNASEADVAGNTSLRSPAERLVVAHAAANSVSFFGSAGIDRFTGGAGNDVFRFSAADLGNTDIVKGGGGNDQLKLTSAGPVHANGVGGVETYVLFNGAGNALTLTGANFAGVTGSAITVDGGNAADMLSGAGLSALDKAVLQGGAGNDMLVAGRNAMLTGGAGKDVFELTVPGSTANPDKVTITDFTHGTDKLALSEKGFALGSSPAAATLFTANPTGSFTSPNQRFAYATGSGELFFDAGGNAAPSTRLEIATLTNHSMLTASDITFVA